MQNFSQLENFLLSQCKPFTLATVIETSGSSYRKPGAKMFIGFRGDTIGQVGGGCFDKDLICHAAELDVGKARIVEYVLGTDEEMYLGTGTGCPGTVRVLLEKLEPEDLHELSKGFGHKMVGKTKLTKLYDSAEEVGFSEHSSEFEILDNFSSDGFQVKNTSDHEIHIFDPLPLQPSLFVFGNGEDAMHVRELGEKLGWSVTMVENIQDPTLLQTNIAEISQSLSPTTAVLAMTHNFQVDRQILEGLVGSPVSYLGIMGAEKRFKKLIEELDRPINAQVLRGPVGLKTGGRTPIEVALSIVSEVQTVFSAGLSERNEGSIGTILEKLDHAERVIA